MIYPFNLRSKWCCIHDNHLRVATHSHTSKKLESLESGLRQFFPFSAKIYALNAKTIKTSLHQYVSICLWSLLPDCRTNSSTEPLLKPLNVLPNTLLSWNFCRDLRTFSANFFWPKGSLCQFVCFLDVCPFQSILISKFSHLWQCQGRAVGGRKPVGAKWKIPDKWEGVSWPIVYN